MEPQSCNCTDCVSRADARVKLFQTCCDTCAEKGEECVAIQHYAQDVNFHYFTQAYGDFKPSKDTSLCPPADCQETLASALKFNDTRVYFRSGFEPVLTSTGRLEHGQHRQLSLGRPAGMCAANVGLRVVGNVMAHNSSLETLGECCDVCVATARCSAWKFEGGTCSLLDTLADGLTWELVEHVFSGLN